LAEPQPGDPSVKNAWGDILNENLVLLEAAITDTATVSINGLLSYSLTTANGSADQARPFAQSYTGALTGNCTVNLPNVPKVGWAQNSTTGGFSVVLTAGAGTTATVPPDGKYYWYKADGATNVVLIGAVGASTPPAGLQYGDMKYSALGIEGNGWRLCNGQTRPQTDPFWVFVIAQSLAASWKPGYTGSSTYNMPNAQDVVLVGLDGMGGATSPGLLTKAVTGFDPTIALNIGGSQLAQKDTLSAAVTATDSGHTHQDTGHTHVMPINNGDGGNYSLPQGSPTPGSFSVNTGYANITTSTANITASATVTSALTGTSQNIQPSMAAAVLMFVGA
jgi:hypothetical protein